MNQTDHCLRSHAFELAFMSLCYRILNYSKTCLKRIPTGPENLSALDRCPPYSGSVSFAWYDHFVGSVKLDTLQTSSR